MSQASVLMQHCRDQHCPSMDGTYLIVCFTVWATMSPQLLGPAHSTLTDPRGPLLAPLPFHPFSCPGLPAVGCDGFEEAPPPLCSVTEPRHWLLIIYCALLNTGPFLHMLGWPTTTELHLLISIVFNSRYGPPKLLKLVLTTVLQPQSPE